MLCGWKLCAAPFVLAVAFAGGDTPFFRSNGHDMFFAGAAQLRTSGVRLGSLRIAFGGKRQAVRPEGREETRIRLSTFARGRLRPSVQETVGYAHVVYRQLWPGMDLEFYYREARIEYDVVASPGAHLADAELRFEGATSLEVQADGSLAVDVSGAKAISTRPIAWVEREGSTWTLPVRYRRTGQDTVTLEVDGWDGQSRLRIDPEIVISTSAAASISDQIGAQWNYDYYRVTNPYARQGALLIAHNGAAVFAGRPSDYVEFPRVAGPGASYGGDRSFVAQRTASAFNGALFDMDSQITALAEDPAGGYLVTGTVTAGQLATTADAYRTQPSTAAGFLLRIRSDFSKIDYATYLDFSPVAIAIDSSRQLYIAGETSNSQPYTKGAYRSPALGKSDIVVLKLASDFKTVRYAALWGGSDTDEPTSISVDMQGGVVVGGLTLSQDLPIPPGAYGLAKQKSQSLIPSGFLARLSADGTTLAGATYLAGSSYDEVRMTQVLPSGEVLVLGTTRSADFPAQGRPLGLVMDSDLYLHGFAVRLDAKLSRATWSMLLANTPLAEAAVAPDDHFCFAVTPYHVQPTADAYLGATAYVILQGMTLVELDINDGRMVYAGGLGRFAFSDWVPFVAAGTGMVGVVGTAYPRWFPLSGTGNIVGFYSNNTFLQMFRFGDTAPVPATASVRGLTPNAPAVDGAVQFPLARRSMSVSAAIAAPPSWLRLDPRAVAPPGALEWHVSPAGWAPGHYTANVALTSIGGTVLPSVAAFEMWVDVLRPSQPVLVASATRGQTATAKLRVAALSGLAFAIAADQPWIQSDVDAAVSPAEITFQFPTANLDSGSHMGVIKLTPNGVAADAVTVPVRLTVN
jgi:hypothetical protein